MLVRIHLSIHISRCIYSPAWHPPFRFHAQNALAFSLVGTWVRAAASDPGETERAGFEPAMECDPHTRLAGECLQPPGHSSRLGTAKFRGARRPAGAQSPTATPLGEGALTAAAARGASGSGAISR